MPLHDFRCRACQQTTEVFHWTQEKVEECPRCGVYGKMTQLIGAPSIRTGAPLRTRKEQILQMKARDRREPLSPLSEREVARGDHLKSPPRKVYG